MLIFVRFCIYLNFYIMFALNFVIKYILCNFCFVLMMFLRNKYFFPNKNELKTDVSWYFNFLAFMCSYTYNCLDIPVLEIYYSSIDTGSKTNCLINRFYLRTRVDQINALNFLISFILNIHNLYYIKIKSIHNSEKPQNVNIVSKISPSRLRVNKVFFIFSILMCIFIRKICLFFTFSWFRLSTSFRMTLYIPEW